MLPAELKQTADRIYRETRSIRATAVRLRQETGRRVSETTLRRWRRLHRWDLVPEKENPAAMTGQSGLTAESQELLDSLQNGLGELAETVRDFFAGFGQDVPSTVMDCLNLLQETIDPRRRGGQVSAAQAAEALQAMIVELLLLPVTRKLHGELQGLLLPWKKNN